MDVKGLTHTWMLGAYPYMDARGLTHIWTLGGLTHTGSVVTSKAVAQWTVAGVRSINTSAKVRAIVLW